MKVYVTQIAGGHEVDVAVYASPEALEATGDFESAAIDTAEAEGEFHDEYGGSLTVTEVDAPPTWAVVVTWQEPDPGVSVYGPFAMREDAEAAAASATDGILADFTNEGELPEDVEIEVQRMGAAR